MPRINLSYVVAALFSGLVSPIAGQSLEISVIPKGSDTFAIVWGQVPSEWKAQRLEIYVSESFLHEFPEGSAIDTLTADARGWYFPKRKGIRILGMDLRDPRYAGEKKYWTPGEVYTFGLRILSPDSLTRKLTERKLYAHVVPFQTGRTPPPSLKRTDIPGTKVISYLPSSARNFINKDIFQLYNSPNHENIKGKILSLGKTENTYVLELNTGDFVLYQMEPKRPFFLGNFFVFSIFLSSLSLVVIGFVLLQLFIKSRSSAYAVQLEEAESEEEQQEILRNLINHKNFPISILFTLLNYRKPNLKDGDIFIDALRKTVRPFRVYQKEKIRLEIEQLFQSGEIARMRRETSIKGNTYEIHVKGNDNIVMTDIKSSNINTSPKPLDPTEGKE
ncbi:MAG: hypothetical protein WA004_10635 [Saprospiraceae bacterium]